MYRISFLFLLFFNSLFGDVSNSIEVTELSGSNQTSRPDWVRVWSAPGEVPATKWVRPFLGGTGASTWQAHQLTYYTSAWCLQQKYDMTICPGSVQSFQVFWIGSYSANSTTKVDFRVSDVPCSGGPTTEAGCASAGLSISGALALGSWDITSEVTSSGSTGVTVTQSLRQMLTDGNACIVYAGPAATVMDAGWATGTGHVCTPIQSRPYAFGFAQKRVLTLNGSVNTSATTWPIYNHSEIAGLSFPQEAFAGPEKISITGATSTSLTVVRAQNGVASSQSNVNIYLVDGKPTLTTAFAPNSALAAELSDASSITAGDIVRIGASWHRTCSKASNQIIIGHEAAPSCTPNEYSLGRGWGGSAFSSTSIPVGHPVVRFPDDLWIAATDDSQKSLTHRAFLYFFSGKTFPGVQVVIHNTWQDRVQTQSYGWKLKAGATVLVDRPWVNHVARSFMVYPDSDIAVQGTYTSDTLLWESEKPGEIARNQNLPWLRALGVVQLDPDIAFTVTSFNSVFTGTESLGNGQIRPGWDDSSKGISSFADAWGTSTAFRVFDSFWIRDEGGGGAYGGLGEYPRWQAQALHLMGKRGSITGWQRWAELIYGSAISGFHAPVYVHSSKTTGTFCNNPAQGTAQEPGVACSTSAYQSIVPFGRSMWSDHEKTFDSVTISSLTGQGRVTRGNWTHNVSFGSSHWFNYFTVPYILRADPLWRLGLESNIAAAHTYSYLNNPFNASANDWFNLFRQTRSESGIAINTSGVRGAYITMRLLGFSVLLPSSPEREMGLTKYRNNVAAREGIYGMTSGLYYNPCTTTKDCSFWRFGNFSKGWDRGEAQSSIPMIEGPISCSVGDTGVNPARNFFPGKPFMYHYGPLAMKTHIDLGLHEPYELYRYLLRVPVNIAVNSAAHASAGTSLGVMTAYGSPDTTMTPEGTDTSCAAQGIYPTVGTNPAFTQWNNYLITFDSTTRAQGFKGATDEFPSLLADRIYLYLAAVGEDVTVPVEELSAKRAWFAIRHRAGTPGNIEAGTIPNYNWSPGWNHRIKGITVTSGTTTASIIFTRPDSSSACSIVYGTSPATNSSDEGETDVATSKHEHIFSLSGLSSQTLYYGRITCKDSTDKRVGRAHFTFNTL